MKVIELSNGVLVSEKRLLWCELGICEERNVNDVVLKRFFPQGEQHLGTNYYYTRDHLGSIRELTDPSAVVIARYAYSPWGTKTKVQGDGIDSTFAFTGLYQFKLPTCLFTPTRIYDCETARWLSRDTLEDAELLQGANLYAYVGNNPVNYLDPSGQGKVGFCIKTVKKIWKKVSRDAAKNALRKGKSDVLVEGAGASKKARKLAKEEWGSKTTRHDPHQPGQMSHYQHKNGGKGHIFYRDTLAGFTGVGIFGDNFFGNAIDFFNPVSDVKDVLDLLDEFNEPDEGTEQSCNCQ